jgi:hypothetical protein
VADGAQVDPDDGYVPGSRAAGPRAGLSTPMGRPPSDDYTRSANSSHPNTTGYQFSRESTHCSGNLARGIGAQSDREISPPIGRVLQDGTELAQGLDC